MADRAVIEQVVREMLTIVSKKVAGPDYQAAVDNYVRHFLDASNEDLLTAVDRWVEQAENPFALPGVRTLRALFRRPVVDTREESEWLPAPAEVVDSHLRARAGIDKRAGSRPRRAHTHRSTDERCLECDAMLSAWAQIVEKLRELPGDPWAGSPRRCRCDGSGMIDTAESRLRLTEWTPEDLAAGLHDRHEVYPCRECNPTQFFDWLERTQGAKR